MLSHRISRSLRWPLLLSASLLFVPGCKDKTAEEAPAETAQAEAPAEVSTLTVYSGRSEKLVAPALQAFEQLSGVDLEIKYGDTAELAAALLDEGENSPADVFIAQDASSLAFLASKDLFAPLPDDIGGRVAETFRADDASWVGLTGRARVLAYNTDKLKPEDLPKSAAELGDPVWKGRVGWAPENASFQSAVAAMVQLEGAEATQTWLEAVKANEPRDYPKNTPAVMAVARGEVDVALVNHYYLYRLRAEQGDDFPVENHYFKDGSAHAMVNLSGAAILKTSAKQDLAAKLLAYLLSDAGQAFFVADNHEFPAAKGVSSPAALPAIDSIGAPTIDLAQLRELEQTHELLRASGVLP
ncbi:iron ABC transporter substrate-binding protein [Haliangium ochraceum]|uniref:Extracellular solute-binding protein family 1 n=1 Tax=Haliangium ochraceum (strain DSM 14365 / JCM 11303 / SMP-2) TaxID=502025 RepID=D0LRS5_HALO1|nr:iron ABC transporter substrate-binding protein [Haliangium ochraceum]ACY19067.1 extracellular solute-binding protein family 1 [Haliangium ochraceum DSM 14365]